MLCRLIPTGEVRDDMQQMVCARGCKKRSGEVRMVWALIGEQVVAGRCKCWPFWWELGEWTSNTLGLVGITPERWGWVMWRLGLQEPGECGGCEVRKEWLNTFGGRLSQRVDWLGRFLFWLLVRRAPTAPASAPDR